MIFVSLFLFPCCAVGQQDYFYEYDVPYVPTPSDVVAEMLRMADVGKDDIVYDLGCGDGRIVITAAEKMGAHGVGIDINPQRIEESRANAVKAKVTDRVRFLEQNFFDADIREATVLTLYLLSSVNLKVRPIIFRQLKPGTRVVSHNYSMGDWKAEQTKNIGSHTVYFWIVPANVSGIWEWTIPAGTGEEDYILQIDQQFQEINGKVTAGSSKLPLYNLNLQGDLIQFNVDKKMDGQKISMMFEGHVSGNSIEGNVKSVAGSVTNESRWKAKRDPSTIIPLDDSDTDL